MKPGDTSDSGGLLFGTLLMWVMVAATATTVMIPVLATFLIDEFGVSRAEIGLIGLVGGVLAAASSPLAGHITDQIGGRSAAIIVLIGSGVASLLLAASPVFGAFFVGAAVAAVAGAAGNPSTNKLIAEHIAPGARGSITGLKQTGPQVGSFLAGLLAPWGASVYGWRPTLAVMGLVLMVPVPALARVVSADRPAPTPTDGSAAPLPAGIWWVAVYGSLLGLGSSAAFLLPLFVEESLGQTPRVAGLAAAVMGGVAALGRWQWARKVEKRESVASTLAVLSSLAIVAAGLMLVSISWGIEWMWVGVVILALSASSWTAVGAMAVIAIAGASAAGRASGVVWFGFLAGLGIGPPIYGFTVDETGSYALMWWLALATFTVASAVALAWARTHRLATTS